MLKYKQRISKNAVFKTDGCPVTPGNQKLG